MAPSYLAIVMLLDVAAGLHIGSVVRLIWPLPGLAGDALGQVVGGSARSLDDAVTFTVLTTRDAGDFALAEFDDDFSGGST